MSGGIHNSHSPIARGVRADPHVPLKYFSADYVLLGYGQEFRLLLVFTYSLGGNLRAISPSGYLMALYRYGTSQNFTPGHSK